MSSSRTSIAVIAKTAEDRKSAVDVLSSPGVTVREFESVAQFQNSYKEELYTGLVIEARLFKEAPPHELKIVLLLEESFPVLKIERDPTTRKLSGKVGNRVLPEEDFFAVYASEICERFPQRGVRFEPRQNVNLNLMVSGDREGKGADTCRAVTLDLSEDGMFIIGFDRRSAGDTIWLTVHSFVDRTPIQALVRWSVPWGATSRHLPGYGIKIVAVTDRQRMEFRKLLDLLAAERA